MDDTDKQICPFCQEMLVNNNCLNHGCDRFYDFFIRCSCSKCQERRCRYIKKEMDEDSFAWKI